MFHRTWQHSIYIVFSIVILSVLVENRSYNNGLIFYDLQTQQAFLPPTVSVSRGRALSSIKYSDKGSIWSTFGKPCDCVGAKCGCCAGIKVKQYNFDEKMCANITFIDQKDEAILDIFLGDKPSARYGISARNPAPFCIPVMLSIPMAMCVQMTDIAVQGNNLNMCMDFIVRLASTDLFEMHFQCMRMGLDGVQYLDKNGQPVLPQGGQLIKYAEQQGEDEEDEQYSEYYDELPAANENEIETNENKLKNEAYPAVQQQVEEEQGEGEEGYNGEQIALVTENMIVTTLAPAVAEYDNSVGDFDGEEVDNEDVEEADNNEIGYVAPALPAVVNETQVDKMNNYATVPAVVSEDDTTNEENVENTYGITAAAVTATTTTATETTTTTAPALAAYADNVPTDAVADTGAIVNTSAEPPYVADAPNLYAEMNEVTNEATDVDVASNYDDNIATEVVEVSAIPNEPAPYVTLATTSYEQLHTATDYTTDDVTASASLVVESPDSTLATYAQSEPINLNYRRAYG